MLRIYARVWAAVIAMAAAVRISRVGLGVSVLYLSSAAIFAYAGYSRRSSMIIRSVVAAMGIFFLAFGSVGSFHHEHPRIPLRRERMGRGAIARCLRWIDDGVRSVVAL
jgi:hypothetical protein